MCSESKDFVLYGGHLGSDQEITENCRSLGEFLLRKLELADQKVLLVDAVTGRGQTAAELRTNAIQLAIGMRDQLGIGAGDRISVCSENRFEFATTWHATLLLGAAMAPINVTYSAGELNHALHLSKPKVVFVSPIYFDKINEAKNRNPFVEKFVVFDDDAAGAANFLRDPYVWPYRRLFGHAVQTPKTFVCAAQDMKNNVSLILCSSGTTGLPKGVQLTQFNLLVANMQHHNRPQDSEMAFNDERIVLGILPWFHAFGIVIFTALQLTATKIVFLPKFEEKMFFESIAKYRANTVYLTPPVMVMLSKHPLATQLDLSCLKCIWCGAAPLSKELEENVRGRLNINVVRQGYGMTEGTLAFLTQNDAVHTSGSVGALRKGLWARVVDLETGQNLGPNRLGELQFKGNCVMKGYVGNDEATKATIDPKGWLHTGDLGYYDEHQEWYTVDRIKELIKYKGYQVPPAEIEGILLQHEGIKDAAVIGIPDELAGELAKAFVVKQPNAQLTENDVREHVAARVSHAKRLHGGVQFVAEIPKNPSGKILRRKLRDLVKMQSAKL